MLFGSSLGCRFLQRSLTSAQATSRLRTAVHSNAWMSLGFVSLSSPPPLSTTKTCVKTSALSAVIHLSTRTFALECGSRGDHLRRPHSRDVRAILHVCRLTGSYLENASTKSSDLTASAEMGSKKFPALPTVCPMTPAAGMVTTLLTLRRQRSVLLLLHSRQRRYAGAPKLLLL